MPAQQQQATFRGKKNSISSADIISFLSAIMIYPFSIFPEFEKGDGRLLAS